MTLDQENKLKARLVELEAEVRRLRAALDEATGSDK